MAPDRTLLSQTLDGRKKESIWMSYLACSNADGSDKVLLLTIDSAVRLQCFNNTSGDKLGFYYRANKKAWITSTIFLNGYSFFSAHIWKEKDRKIILLMDHASSSWTEESIPVYDNVTILFLPPNTTSKLQPMDAGIIAALKRSYRKFQYKRAFDALEAVLAADKNLCSWPTNCFEGWYAFGIVWTILFF